MLDSDRRDVVPSIRVRAQSGLQPLERDVSRVGEPGGRRSRDGVRHATLGHRAPGGTPELHARRHVHCGGPTVRGRRLHALNASIRVERVDARREFGAHAPEVHNCVANASSARRARRPEAVRRGPHGVAAFRVPTDVARAVRGARRLPGPVSQCQLDARGHGLARLSVVLGLLSGRPTPVTFVQRLVNAVDHVHTNLIRRYYDATGIFGIASGYSLWPRPRPRNAMVFVNTHHSLEPATPLGPIIVENGGIHLRRPMEPMFKVS